MHKFIRLHSGAKFDFRNIDINSININDIAHSLSQQTRFTGHAKSFYSVAEHCCRGTRIVDGDLKLNFLLHDATEAYMGDLNNPLKQIIPQFKEIEAQIDRIVAQKFELFYLHHKKIKEADLIMLATEMRDLMPGEDWKDLSFPPLVEKIEPWTQEKAKNEFLILFEMLSSW